MADNARGVYSDLELEAAVASGEIVCNPLVPKNIQGSSIDLTLGMNFYRCDHEGSSTIYNPKDEQDVARYFKDPWEGMVHEAWVEEQPKKRQPFVNIPLDANIIVMRPRERILGRTHEFVGIREGTCQLQTRSTWGRNGLSVCLCAGWGDPFYIFPWTLELYNWNNEFMPLVVGDRICQMAFYRTGPVRHKYGLGNKYQFGEDLGEKIANWTPELMLPRAFKDDYVAPMPHDANEDPREKLMKSLQERGLSIDHITSSTLPQE
jgi:dCTP deaminase